MRYIHRSIFGTLKEMNSVILDNLHEIRAEKILQVAGIISATHHRHEPEIHLFRDWL